MTPCACVWSASQLTAGVVWC